jgi:8-oxo-dGTP pyrophosphatase MutT (NUDIX family)
MVEQQNPRTGRKTWTLPGGGLEPDDTNIFAGVEREVMEETGLRVQAGAVRFVSEFANTHVGVMQLSIWIECTPATDVDANAITTQFTRDDDYITQVKWWSREAIMAELPPQASVRKPEFWAGMEAVPTLAYLGKRVEVE